MASVVMPRPIDRTQAPIAQSTSLVTGMRIRMSELGAARCPRIAEKTGVIVGRSQQNSSVRVLFNGSRSPVSLHRDYVEQISSAEE
jgi:hypothetical protein